MTSQNHIKLYKNYKTTKRRRENHFLYYAGLVLK